MSLSNLRNGSPQVRRMLQCFNILRSQQGNPATDPRLRGDLYNNVLHRGVGRPKPQEDEDAGGKKKGGNPAEFLEMLAAI